jgi:hypothetical protein
MTNRFFIWGKAALVRPFSFVSCRSSENWRIGVDRDGYTVTRQDGTVSKSVEKQGACSRHGGVR